MTEYNSLFSDKYLKEKLCLSDFIVPNIESKLTTVKGWVREVETKNIYTKKEEQIQSDFLNDIFGKVLEYAYERGLDEYNLEKEEKSKTDSTKPDGVLGYLTATDKDIRVVIELKDAYTNLDHKQNRKNDNRTPVEQAFSYVSKSGGNCKWVIVSNFVEIRLYPSNDSSAYQQFVVKDLSKPEVLKTFYALLAKDRLFCRKTESIIDELLKNKIEADTQITKKFYDDYKKCRASLFSHIKENNPNIDDNVILTKSQKILDRIIFICFCEDIGLLPYKVFKQILEEAKNARFDTRETKLWERTKALFNMIDKGYPTEHINRFNGGLFKEDSVIDNLIIKDSVLESIISLETYDFESDLNVNILGHIFEQSITDLEEIKASFNGEEVNKKTGKRKKDGIFYTPEYITRYIVDEAVGGWLENKKKELGFYELPKFSDEEQVRLKTGKTRKNNTKIKAHLDFWLKFREALKNITILDPACGSGSFLVQVFDYLKEQSRLVNEEITNLEGPQPNLFNYDKHILSHNIYGVDLNAESVEITKLALWLKTANKNDPLTSLDNNIKCGNSLVDDPEIDPEHAFDWNKEFSDIMSKEKGGFDVIVGNPPYGVSFNEIEKKYLQSKYGNIPDFEIYIFFIELYRFLLKKDGGYLSYIFPNTFLSNLFGKEYRKNLISVNTITNITDLSCDTTFEDASVRSCIFTFRKKKEHYTTRFNTIVDKNIVNKFTISKNIMLKNIENLLSLFHQSAKEKKIIKKLLLSKKINEFCEVSQGLIPYDKYRGHDENTIKNRIWNSTYCKDSTYRKELKGEDIRRYFLLWNGNTWISYGNWLAAPREQKYFVNPRILVREITSNRLNAVYTEEEYYNTPSIINIISSKINLKLLLGIVNSNLIGWYHNKTSPKAQKGLFPKILVNDIRNIPVSIGNVKKQKTIIDLVDVMLTKNKELQEISDKFYNLLTGDFKDIKINASLANWYDLEWIGFTDVLKKQKIHLTGTLKDDWYDRFNRLSQQAKTIKLTLDTTDKQIDSMVYELYDLTNDEIKVIEKDV